MLLILWTSLYEVTLRALNFLNSVITFFELNLLVVCFTYAVDKSYHFCQLASFVTDLFSLYIQKVMKSLSFGISCNFWMTNASVSLAAESSIV